MAMTIEEKKARSDARKESRKQAKEQARIDGERNQKPVKEITITIEWKKSRTWGSNPHAEAQVEFQDGTHERRNGYTASGCGYDKESTVIASVFNDFLKYKLYGLIARNGTYPSMDCVPYGVRLTPEWKYYDGGIGTNCYYKISEYIGGKFERIASGKTFDVYKYTDNKEV